MLSVKFHPVETTRCTDKREAWHGEADRRSPYTNVMSTDAENVALLHGRRNRGVQGVHVPPTFSGRGVQEGTLCESLCVSRCAVNGFVPF